MLFNLADFLRGISKALDFIEEDIFGVPTNHSKRIALTSLRIGQLMNLSDKELFDIAALALLHDNGASIKLLQDGLQRSTTEKRDLLESMQAHCKIGEESVAKFIFMTRPENVIKYHHENHDGTGFFGLRADQIPLMSQIIHLADKLDLDFHLNGVFQNPSVKENLIAYVRKYKGTYFSPAVADTFLLLTKQDTVWRELTDMSIASTLKKSTPDFCVDQSYCEIRKMTQTFSKIIDAKSAFTQLHSSGLAEKAETMAKYYEFGEDKTQQLLIAADLHDLGKMSISNTIIDKPGILTTAEFSKMKTHPGVAKVCLEEIKGFEPIVQWIFHHHEKLDGSGYPQGLTGDKLDFESRLLICLDIYQALTEERPYRKAMDFKAAGIVLHDMVMKNLIDSQIVNDIILNMRP